MSHKSVPQECPTRVSHKSVPQQCPLRVSHKSVPQQCPTRVSYKSVPQELPTRVSHKSFLLECPTRVSRKSVPQEFPTRVSHKSVLQECHLDICSFSNVFAFGFVGSILFFFFFFFFFFERTDQRAIEAEGYRPMTNDSHDHRSDPGRCPLLIPRDPSTFSEGVWGGFGGSKCLLRRYLDP